MPTLHWIGKDKVINHHRDVPYKVLEHGYGFDAEKGKTKQPTGSGNMVIHGDNLEALKSLLPQYEGKVKCIYIDPPYNTGNEGWVYNDNVNDPRIKKWLGDVVGKEGEDLSRHDKWLCMMYPRLVLLHKLLAEDGSLWVSLDDTEQGHARLILDEIFGGGNFVADVAWHKRVSPGNDAKYFSMDYDHTLVYAKSKSNWTPKRVPRNEAQLKYYTNPDNDPRGPWNSSAYTCAKSADERPNLYYPVINPNTGEEIWPKRTRVWAYEKATHERNVDAGLLWWGVDGTAKMPRLKKFLGGRDVVPRTIWFHDESGHNQEAKVELDGILGSGQFQTPKPTRFIERILNIAGNESAIILDSFAGSGTTAHAVLNLNKQDGGNRKFILIEMMDYAETITAERVKRVMTGYGDGKKAMPGTGGSFDYYTLGATLFNGQEQLNEEVGVERIREYIWYSETRSPLQASAQLASGKSASGKGAIPGQARNDASTALGASNGYYLGTHERTAFYFVYEKEALTTLDHELLATLTVKGERTVIYADNCLLPKKFLEQHGIVFKKIPRDISRF